MKKNIPLNADDNQRGSIPGARDEQKNRFLVHLMENEIRDLISIETKKSIMAALKDSEINQPIEFYTRDDLAKLFKCTPNTISDWVKFYEFPEPDVKNGKSHRWLKSTIEKYINKK